jgi:hypothetical protein
VPCGEPRIDREDDPRLSHNAISDRFEQSGVETLPVARLTGPAATITNRQDARIEREGRAVTTCSSRLSAKNSTSITPATLPTTPRPTATASGCPESTRATDMPRIRSRG